MYENRRYQAKLIVRNQVSKDGFELIFQPEEKIEFTAGQYAWVVLDKLSYPDQRGNKRAFSITSTPQQSKSTSIYFRARKPVSGYKRTLLEIPLNSNVTLEAPFGCRTLPADKTVPIVLVAGGTGIASYMSSLRQMNRDAHWRPIKLIYANKRQEEVAFQNELEEFRGGRKSSLSSM